jgi:hypothetical protein
MAMNPEDWLMVEQVMEEENHSLLQTKVSDTPTDPTPQLLTLSSHVVKGTSSATTFSIIIIIEGKRGIALIDSGSTDTFLDYTFASKSGYNIISTASKTVKVVGGGQLETSVVTMKTSYFIQGEDFSSDFKLLQLKGYDVILGCDWIKAHSPIGLDLREDPNQLTIHKHGHKKVVFSDFTQPPTQHVINALQLEKMCRSELLGYVIQINNLQQPEPDSDNTTSNSQVAAILKEFEDVFSAQLGLPPSRPCDHTIPLKEGSQPPNLRVYRIPYN